MYKLNNKAQLIDTITLIEYIYITIHNTRNSIFNNQLQRNTEQT